MNLKTLIALIAAALVIGGLTLKMMKKDSAEWQTVQTDGFLFEGLPINDVDQINITKGSDTLTLGRERISRYIFCQSPSILSPFNV